MFWHVFFFKQKTAYEMRISDWGSDVCASDLSAKLALPAKNPPELPPRQKGAIAVARSRPASLSEPWSACATSSTDAPLPSASQVAVTARSISPRSVSLGAVTGRAIWLTNPLIDRQSVVLGKSVSVRVDLGGGRINKKKINIKTKH